MCIANLRTGLQVLRSMSSTIRSPPELGGFWWPGLGMCAGRTSGAPKLSPLPALTLAEEEMQKFKQAEARWGKLSPQSTVAIALTARGQERSQRFQEDRAEYACPDRGGLVSGTHLGQEATTFAVEVVPWQ